MEILTVQVSDMLQARDERAENQRRMLEKYHSPLISFTLNIAGPVKRDEWIECAFDEGVRRIEAQIGDLSINEVLEKRAFTGCERLWSVCGDAETLKRRMRFVEERDALGRLMDMDVLNAQGEKLVRPDGERKCLLCGGSARVCARSRRHSAEELARRTREIIVDHFQTKRASHIAELAERALLCELAVTPKPGLVDMETNGAHEDMDRFTFVRSACALRPCFERCARLGMENRSTEETFFRLRREGLLAEETMLAATGGVNTHKGAIFSLGLLCCAAGAADEPWANASPLLKTASALPESKMKSAAESKGSEISSAKGVFEQIPCTSIAEAEHTTPPFPESVESRRAALLRRAAALAAYSMEDLSVLSPATAKTGGERDYLRTGRTGARGEAAAGFPSVVQIALPTLEKALAEGKSANLAGLEALTALMRTVADANVLRRAGEEGLKRVQHSTRQSDASPESLRALDREFTAERLSPGGCADLLAAAWLLHFLEED